MGLRAIVLARRLCLHSVLPAPSVLLPDPDLSERIMPAVPAFLDHAARHPARLPPRNALEGLVALLHLCAGRRRVCRWLEPA